MLSQIIKVFISFISLSIKRANFSSQKTPPHTHTHLWSQGRHGDDLFPKEAGFHGVPRWSVNPRPLGIWSQSWSWHSSPGFCEEWGTKQILCVESKFLLQRCYEGKKPTPNLLSLTGCSLAMKPMKIFNLTNHLFPPWENEANILPLPSSLKQAKVGGDKS